MIHAADYYVMYQIKINQPLMGKDTDNTIDWKERTQKCVCVIERERERERDALCFLP